MAKFPYLNTSMEDDIEFFVRRSTTELMLALFKLGYRRIPVGAMMRIIGVEGDHATEYDDQVIQLDDEFAKYLQTVLDGMEVDTSGDHILH